MLDKKIGAMVVAAAAVWSGMCWAAQDVPLGQQPRPTLPIKPAAKVHLDAAAAAAAPDDWSFNLAQCAWATTGDRRPSQPATGSSPVEFGPQKVFDNFYFVGLNQVSSWALTTSDGIILFDTLNNSSDAANVIEAGLVKLGLDPSKIKYIVLSHGHGDHTGGAKYLVDKYKSRTLLSDADWKLLEASAAALPPAPAPGQPARPPAQNPVRDITVVDGQKLTLGDETVTFYITPGHTPGSVSTIFQVKDKGVPHTIAMLGGTGLDRVPPGMTRLEMYKTYAQNIDKFAAAAKAAGADVPLSNHNTFDNGLVRMGKLRQRRPNDPNPMISGAASVGRFFTVLSECAKANAIQAEG